VSGVGSDADALRGDRTIRVAALRHGTVIDHLRRGTGLKVLSVLGLIDTGTVAIGLNLESGKLGGKDLIKIENRELSREDVNRIALLSPEATLSIIRDYEVALKFRPELSDELVGLLRCPNPNCVSNHEAIATKFQVRHRNPLRLRCFYCERGTAAQSVELL
jgi:aspartate carbamoyltransferase regulatory subunit